jgi:hypothetical protein
LLLMGRKKIKSDSGFWSAAASWFASFGSAMASDSNRRDGHDAAAGMVVAVKHFSTAHGVKFG